MKRHFYRHFLLSLSCQVVTKDRTKHRTNLTYFLLIYDQIHTTRNTFKGAQMQI